MKLIRLEDVKEWPDPRDLTPEEEAEVYRLAREQFTAADLAEYLQPDIYNWPDLGEFLDEMEQEVTKERDAEQGQDPKPIIIYSQTTPFK